MGDTAEKVYQKVAPLGDTTRFRLRRPKGVKFGTFPVGFRYMPEFITAFYLVEAMGVGRDGILKSMEESKFGALKEWNKFAKRCGLGLMVFVWNSSKRQFITLAWADVVREVTHSKKKYGVQQGENDGEAYFRLDWDRLVAAATYVGGYEEDEE